MAVITTDKIKKGIRIFLLITIPTLLLLLLLTVDKKTWEALRQVNAPFLFLTLLVTLMRVFVETFRIQALSWAGGKRITLKDSLDFNLGSLFLAAVTPFQSGGIPLQLYILNRSGLSLGRGTNVVLLKGLLPTFLFLFSLPFILFFYKNLFDSPLIRILGKYITTLYTVLLLILLYIFLNPPWIRKGLYFFEGYLRRKRVLKGEGGIKLLEKGFHQLEEFKKGLKESLGMGKLKILLALLLSIVGLLLHMVTAPFLLLGLGVNPPFLTAMVLQMLLYFLLLFVPTPGASGIAEFASSALFNSICPKPLIGIFVILLRFFYLYLAASIGGILLFQRVKSQEILSRSQ